jgi:hypothetical protein
MAFTRPDQRKAINAENGYTVGCHRDGRRDRSDSHRYREQDARRRHHDRIECYQRRDQATTILLNRPNTCSITNAIGNSECAIWRCRERLKETLDSKIHGYTTNTEAEQRGMFRLG